MKKNSRVEAIVTAASNALAEERHSNLVVALNSDDMLNEGVSAVCGMAMVREEKEVAVLAISVLQVLIGCADQEGWSTISDDLRRLLAETSDLWPSIGSRL